MKWFSKTERNKRTNKKEMFTHLHRMKVKLA